MLKKIKNVLKREDKHSDNTVKNNSTDLIDETTGADISEKNIGVGFDIKEISKKYDKKHIWGFTSGHESGDFRGNPKYLFVYINRYREDIFAYWICNSETLFEEVNKVEGSNAFLIDTPECQLLLQNTGVLVAEQVKASLPENCRDIIYLNLWHGIGYKNVERLVRDGQLMSILAQKYIHHNDFYKNKQIMLTGSDSNIVRESTCLGLTEEHFIKAAYPRCNFQNNFEPVRTFDHDIRKIKGLDESAKIVVYAPTFRKNKDPLFNVAIPDMKTLHECCERKNYLFVFKVHPYLEDDNSFINLREKFMDHKHFLFWDNQNDFYEILDQVDIAIYDYSSIFSDMLAVGVRHFLRYVFDYEEYFSSGLAVEEYYLESTAGKMVRSFSELMSILDEGDIPDCSLEVDRLQEQLWGYSNGKADFDKIIDSTLRFEPTNSPERNLYSFDIFDTLFSRKVLMPEGVFYYVKRKMLMSGGYPEDLVYDYPKIRKEAESNVRVCKRLKADAQKSEWVEITFDEIIQHISELYSLSKEQEENLRTWELEAELENVIPLREQINKVHKLVEAGNTVVLISDMYLPLDFIRELLSKADPLLGTLPVFLSNEYGVHKASGKLYLKAYSSFEPYYDFSNWYHFGDNANADVNQARSLKIKAQLIKKPSFNTVEKSMVENLNTYDSFLLAAMQARMRNKYKTELEEFIIDYIAPFIVPYISWVIRDAMNRGYKTLYFVSRDGYHLKRIADSIISSKKLDLKTRYIYASRRTWRLPSFIDDIDETYWDKNGNFERIGSADKLLKALEIDEEQFNEFFPALDLNSIEFDEKDITDTAVIDVIKCSPRYRDFLLNRAAEERKIVVNYLKQELDATESFVFVDYYGSGFTQDCLVRIYRHYTNDPEADVPFYYSRSLFMSEEKGSIRYNFTTGPANPHITLESIFSNMPYKTVAEYEIKEGRIEPVLRDNYYDVQMFNTLEEILPEYARRYAQLDFFDGDAMDRKTNRFIQSYYADNKLDPIFLNFLAPLKDSPTMFGIKKEFAPAYTQSDLEKIQSRELKKDDALITHSPLMSLERSESFVKREYKSMFQIFPEEINSVGGAPLNEEATQRSIVFEEKYNELFDRSITYQRVYEDLVETVDIKELVLFIVNNVGFETSGLATIKEAIDLENIIETDVIKMGEVKTPEQITTACRRIAEARFIVVDNAIHNLCRIQFREGTKEILIPPTNHYIFGKALGAEPALRWEKRFNKLAYVNDFSVIQVPSKNQIDLYKALFFPNKNVSEYIIGCCNTDPFFEPNTEKCRQKVISLFPEAENKKIILFAPALRPIKDWGGWAKFIDLRRLETLIGNDYVVIVNYNKKQAQKGFSNLEDISGFSKTIIGDISVRDLAIACDIIISDYRDIMFESIFLRKPMFSFAYDHEERMRGKNALVHDYNDCLFCPIVRTADDLAMQIKDIDKYDFKGIDDYIAEKFDGCDGHSVEKVVKYIEAHRK